MASKKKSEEYKRKEEEERLLAAQRAFVDAFSEGPKLDKTWIKAGTAESEARGDDSGKRELYKPSSKLAETAGLFKSQPIQQQKEDLTPSKQDTKKKSSKVSNLERFKEELKALQEERAERKKLRSHIKECEEKGVTPTLLTSSGKPSRFDAPPDVIQNLDINLEKDIYGNSTKSDNDSTSTNVYCGNLSPKMTENVLCELFGKYGPLASVKIMYPRTEEEKAKNRNTGFVGFMRRSDAEEAYSSLKGQTIMGYEMRLSWGKCIPIPPRPIYIPPSMVNETLPPPPSGLPFNAQPPPEWQMERDPYGNPDFSKNLDQTEVKIVIPTDRVLLCLIHRMVEYVVREGPLFEAMIMNREMNNPRFRFLFDNQLPAHCYYRWKLYSILLGDEPHVWNVKPFQMFEGGSYWIPPKMNPYMQKQVKEAEKTESVVPTKKAILSSRQRERLEDILRDMSSDRIKIGDGMIWCLEHAEAAEEVVEIIADSLSISDTPLPKKLARLYLISDILYNTSTKLPNVSYYRKHFESALPTIFKSFNEAYEQIDGRLTAENFKQKIMACFRAWEDWVIYPIDHLIKCQNIFLGILTEDDIKKEEDDDVDGAPLSPMVMEADIDGEPLEKMKNALKNNSKAHDEDIDGEPVSEDIDGEPIKLDGSPSSDKPKFAASKWETLDEETVKSQAVTTSKWEMLEESKQTSKHEVKEEDIDGAPISSPKPYKDQDSENIDDEEDSLDLSRSGLSGLSALSAAYTPKLKKPIPEMTEKRRGRLREIELKVVKYQDELEAGKRSRKLQLSIAEQVQIYRQKLLEKEQEEVDEEVPPVSRSPPEKERVEKRKKTPEKSRSNSPQRRSSRRSRSKSSTRSSRNRRSRSRSRSPRKNKRSRSKSPDRHSRHKKYR